jgi:hypothetical protein
MLFFFSYKSGEDNFYIGFASGCEGKGATQSAEVASWIRSGSNKFQIRAANGLCTFLHGPLCDGSQRDASGLAPS